jgi:hypothetical protein
LHIKRRGVLAHAIGVPVAVDLAPAFASLAPAFAILALVFAALAPAKANHALVNTNLAPAYAAFALVLRCSHLERITSHSLISTCDRACPYSGISGIITRATTYRALPRQRVVRRVTPVIQQ